MPLGSRHQGRGRHPHPCQHAPAERAEHGTHSQLLRRGGRRPTAGPDGAADPRIERAIAIDADGNPRRAAELRQTYARLLRALDSLPAEMRTTVVLVALQGLSHGEAAVVQRCSEGTISWRMHEARR